MSTSIAALQLDPQSGFLPLQDPLSRLPQGFDAWENTALGRPKRLASDHVRRTIEEIPRFPLLQIAGDMERERAMTLLSYLGQAYVWQGARPAEGLPK